MQGRKMLLHFLHSLHPCNSAIAEEQKSANAMDGVNADFQEQKSALPPTPVNRATEHPSKVVDVISCLFLSK
ncbi:MAG: hypothetical protein KJ725_06110 [Gammaproteobacteria bacterium]|nr:hypothetical protein [Gammaproteobacteria bacterium]